MMTKHQHQDWYFLAMIVVAFGAAIALTPPRMERGKDQICIVSLFSETCYDREILMEFKD